jgi:hypothetical protein
MMFQRENKTDVSHQMKRRRRRRSKKEMMDRE